MIGRIFRKRRIEEVLRRVNKKDLLKRYTMLTIGCIISAFAFNVFFLQYSIVCFGVSGLSIVLNEFGVNPSLFILVSNVLLLVISYFTLGFEKTKDSIVGSLLFPVMVSLTGIFIPLLDIKDLELIVIAIFGAVLSGVGYGIIFKTGFTTGGTDIVNQILVKYFKMSMGKAIIIVDGFIVICGKMVFSWEIVLYGFIVLYIISVITDKVILGISQSKAFYIVTDNEEEVKDYLLSVVNGGVTIINSRGGYSQDKHQLLLAVVPTRMYFMVKEGITELDPNVFFLVCDAYEVSSKETKYDKC